MKLIIYFISFFSFISSLAQGNNGQILKTIPDTVRVNDTFKLVKVTQSSVFESSNCFFLRNKTDTSFLDTLKTNLFFEYPQLQFGGLCIRYDTFKLILNTLGTKYIISEWLMRDSFKPSLLQYWP